MGKRNFRKLCAKPTKTSPIKIFFFSDSYEKKNYHGIIVYALDGKFSFSEEGETKGHKGLLWLLDRFTSWVYVTGCWTRESASLFMERLVTYTQDTVCRGVFY